MTTAREHAQRSAGRIECAVRISFEGLALRRLQVITANGTRQFFSRTGCAARAPSVRRRVLVGRTTAQRPRLLNIRDCSRIVGVDVVRFDPSDTSNRRICAGTFSGVYVRADGGSTWAPAGTGMPKVRVHDLVVSLDGSLVRAATRGRGLWELATR